MAVSFTSTGMVTRTITRTIYPHYQQHYQRWSHQHPRKARVQALTIQPTHLPYFQSLFDSEHSLNA